MKKIILIIIFNLLVLALFGQMFIGDLPHPYEPDEAFYIPDVNGQLKFKQAEKQRLDSSTYQSYNYVLDQWEINFKNEYTYNNDENLVLHHRFIWNNNAQRWTAHLKYEYTYDNEGSLTQYMLSTWYSSIQDWTPNIKYEYTYDGNGKLVSYLQTRRDDNTQIWENSIRREYTYDNNDNLTSYINLDWDDDTQTWVNFTKREYTYDNNGNLILYTNLDWDNNAMYWKNDRKRKYTYDNEERLISYLISTWDDVDQQWFSSYREEYAYDNEENLTTVWLYHLKGPVEILMHKNEYAYDNSYTYDELIIPLPKLYARHKPISISRKDWKIETQEWIEDRRTAYYYSEQIVGITPATEAGIEIFPNPANDFITFNLENTNSTTVQLYDAQGKHIRTQALAQNNQLSVRHLDSGTYFYQLLYDGEMYSGKFIVK